MSEISAPSRAKAEIFATQSGAIAAAECSEVLAKEAMATPS
jgi:hypothetical protein